MTKIELAISLDRAISQLKSDIGKLTYLRERLELISWVETNVLKVVFASPRAQEKFGYYHDSVFAARVAELTEQQRKEYERIIEVYRTRFMQEIMFDVPEDGASDLTEFLTVALRVLEHVKESTSGNLEA